MQTRLTERRRALHRIPELGFDLPKTHAYLAEALAHCGAQVRTVAQCGLLAYFDFGRAQTALFRSDMDALAVEEQTGAAFCSTHSGQMHACGHDGHMAMLLALADYAGAHPDEMTHNLLLVFQPAEESGGGGGVIVNGGALEGYDISRAFALHVDPMLPSGTLGSRPGPFMAHASELNFTVHGRAAHVARFSEGRDALAAAADFLTRARSMERALPPDVPRLLKFGMMHAGSAVNILADEARLGGTLRTYDDALFEQLRDGLCRHAAECEREYGVRFDLNFAEGYPAVINDAPLYRQARAALEGIPFTELEQPSLLAEDFGFYAQRFPSLMLFVGLGTGIPLHSPQFNFDERALMTGAQALIRLAQMA